MNKKLMVIENLINERNLQKAVDKMYDFAFGIDVRNISAEIYDILPCNGEMIKDVIKSWEYSISDDGHITKIEGLSDDVYYNYYNSDDNEIIIYNLNIEVVKSIHYGICEIVEKYSLKKAN